MVSPLLWIFSQLHEDSLSSYQAPGSCGPSWSLAAAWALLHWRSASWGHSFAGQGSQTECPKHPCQTYPPHRARCPSVSAEVDRRTRRRNRVTHRSHSYLSDSLKLKEKISKFYMFFTELHVSYSSSTGQYKYLQYHQLHHDGHQMEAESYLLNVLKNQQCSFSLLPKNCGCFSISFHEQQGTN